MPFFTSQAATRSRRSVRRAFTLVEILIVVIILGILAAIVIPQFSNASEDARRNSALTLLQTMRQQIELYKMQHGDKWPTADGTIGAGKVLVLTKLTDAADYPAGSGKSYGPYLQQTPVNPYNSSSTVVAAPAVGAGWVFTAEGKLYTVDGASPPNTIGE